MATAHESPSTVPRTVRESRWWYGVVAYLAYTLLSVVIVAPLVLSVVFLDVLGITRVAFFVVAVLAALFAVVGLAISVLLPVSIYKDGQTILASGTDWEPDVELLAILAVVGIFVNPLGIGVAIYYLYKRHESVGTP